MLRIKRQPPSNRECLSCSKTNIDTFQFTTSVSGKRWQSVKLCKSCAKLLSEQLSWEIDRLNDFPLTKRKESI